MTVIPAVNSDLRCLWGTQWVQLPSHTLFRIPRTPNFRYISPHFRGITTCSLRRGYYSPYLRMCRLKHGYVHASADAPNRTLAHICSFATAIPRALDLDLSLEPVQQNDPFWGLEGKLLLDVKVALVSAMGDPIDPPFWDSSCRPSEAPQTTFIGVYSVKQSVHNVKERIESNNVQFLLQGQVVDSR